MFTKNTSLVIPTHNRSKNIEATLKNLQELKLRFFEIIIVDSSNKKEKKLLKSICEKYDVKLINSYPSTSHQRNLGLKSKDKNTKFIMFLDDDLIFFQNSFQEMDKFINNKKIKRIIAYSFNHYLKTKNNLIEKIKISKISNLLSLYSKKPGIVMNSGWHTKIINLKRNTFVQWLPTAAVIFHSSLIKNKTFDESFGRYSYLEDLDFSLSVKKDNYKFVVVSKAKFFHPNHISRINFKFGYLEIINRFKIVSKYNLNELYFLYMGVIKSLFSLLYVFSGNINYIFKFLGNCFGLVRCLCAIIKNNFLK